MQTKSSLGSLLAAALIVALALVVASAPAVAFRPPSSSVITNTASAYFHPNVLYFKVGRTSSATTTLTNTGTQTLIIVTLDLTGLRQNDFTFSTTCFPTLAAGQSCTVTLSGIAPHTGFFGQLVEGDNSGLHKVTLEGK